ncbi:hypothetical protein OG417_12350 [Actinoallomurus sp. NBC_01490]|uniref:hypothetical protein n=1 Tax=Actinoallomurus sp. NBC_01490 TaxID=2903557 RepID=UPI002E370837|nr:hypothetical protein [Actinoallomurus sp. NBC_01490]
MSERGRRATVGELAVPHEVSRSAIARQSKALDKGRLIPRSRRATARLRAGLLTDLEPGK